MGVATYPGHEVIVEAVDKVKESAPQQIQVMMLPRQATPHLPDHTQSRGDALQVPLGPAYVEEQLVDLIVGQHDLLSEQDVQRPGGVVVEGEGGGEAHTGGQYH